MGDCEHVLTKQAETGLDCFLFAQSPSYKTFESYRTYKHTLGAQCRLSPAKQAAQKAQSKTKLYVPLSFRRLGYTSCMSS